MIEGYTAEELFDNLDKLMNDPLAQEEMRKGLDAKGFSVNFHGRIPSIFPKEIYVTEPVGLQPIVIPPSVLEDLKQYGKLSFTENTVTEALGLPVMENPDVPIKIQIKNRNEI